MSWDRNVMEGLGQGIMWRVIKYQGSLLYKSIKGVCLRCLITWMKTKDWGGDGTESAWGRS
jgi:cbb3-type cytochrome oxidase subunit 1